MKKTRITLAALAAVPFFAACEEMGQETAESGSGNYAVCYASESTGFIMQVEDIGSGSIDGTQAINSRIEFTGNRDFIPVNDTYLYNINYASKSSDGTDTYSTSFALGPDGSLSKRSDFNLEGDVKSRGVIGKYVLGCSSLSSDGIYERIKVVDSETQAVVNNNGRIYTDRTTEVGTLIGEDYQFSDICRYGDYVLVSYTSVLEREGKTTFTNLARNTYIGVYTFDPSDPEYEYLKFQNLIVRKSEEHPGEPAGQISGNSSSRVETGIEPVDNGDIYLFVQGNRSNRDGDTSLPPCTVLRISKSGMDNGKPVAIDDDYYVDLGKAGAGEYRLWRSYYLGGTRFCLQFFTDPGETGAKATHSRFGIFDYESKTLTWVSGAPEDITDVSLLYLIEKDKNRVTFGMETASMKPALYSIYADGTMKRGLEVNAESIEGVALLK